MRRARRAALWGAGLAALGMGSLVAIGLHQAVADPMRRSVSLTLPGLQENAPPYRIALLSDIHIGNRAMSPERLTRIVAAVNGAKPDLVVITGDFVNGHGGQIASDPADLVAPLRQLKPRDGTFATMGNHDHWTDLPAIKSALEQAGITVLSNQARQIGPLVLLGFDDRYTGHADLAATMAEAKGLTGVPVAINHSPDLAPELPGEVPLLLAGHTHCGQVVFPVIGSLAPIFGRLMGDRHYYFPRYQCGIVREGSRTTVVTAGLGSGSIPLRIGAAPDWWLVTLQSPRP